MIIRKPYAFLIKNFRSIHLLLTILLSLIMIKSYNIFSLISKLISGEANRYSAINYINYGLFFLILISLVIFLFIYILMKHKKKPKLIYMTSFLGYVFLIILLIFVFTYFKTLQSELLDEKIIRIYRDLFLLLIGFQVIVIVIMLVRGLGFDIKKFDFKKDLQELNISEEDAEEVEVNVKVNTNKIIGFFNRIWREFKYYVKENKLIFIFIVVIIVVILTITIIKILKGDTNNYSLNETFITDKYEMKIKNSYVTNLNYNNEIIDKDKYFVIVSFNIKGITTNKNSINNASLLLKSGKNTYYPEIKYCDNFIDLGACYREKTISNKNYNNYILVYTITSKDINKSKYFIYEYAHTPKTTSAIKVKLEEKDIYTINTKKEYKIGDKLQFNGNIIENKYLQINNFSLGKIIEYTYMEKDEEKVDIITSKNKSILRLDIDTDIDNLSSSNILKYYTKLKYTIGDEEYIGSYTLKKSNNPEILFLEISEKIENADKIWLNIDVRNEQYIYTIK